MQILYIKEENDFLIAKDRLEENIALTLHEIHGKRIAIEFPTPLNNQSYILRSKGCVGQIPIGNDLLLQITPKMPIKNLFRMLEYAYKLQSFNFLKGIIRVDSLNDLFENLVSILTKRVLDRARRGLYQGYIKEEEALPYIRGRIMLMPTLRSYMKGSTRLECLYEEHTQDLDDNRILAWTLHQLLRFPFKREDVRRQIRQAYRILSRTVEVTHIDTKKCINRFYHKLNEDYRPMHGLCRFFLEHFGPGIDTGEYNFIPFVINMPSLFESFVAEWLKLNVPTNIHVASQYRADLDQSGTLYFKVDLVITDVATDQVLAVLDTKDKRKQKPEESDIEQIVAYAVRMNTLNAFLVYPSNITQAQPFYAGNVRGQILSFDIGADPEEAGKRFLKRVSELLNI